MEVKVFKQVEKILKNETREIREDIADILEKIVIGIPLGMPHVKSLASISSGLYEISVKDRAGQFRLVYFILHKDTSEKVVILKRLQEIKNEEN